MRLTRAEGHRTAFFPQLETANKRLQEQERAHKATGDERHRHHIQEIEALRQENERMRQQTEELANQVCCTADVNPSQLC